jgi:hypothetical protein
VIVRPIPADPAIAEPLRVAANDLASWVLDPLTINAITIALALGLAVVLVPPWIAGVFTPAGDRRVAPGAGRDQK